MLFFDVTKASSRSHFSGLMRVSHRLRLELARHAKGGLTEVAWSSRLGTFVGAARELPIRPEPEDWLVTPELISEEERPGLTAWLAARPCRAAAIFYDAIPLRFPEITWPHSVARHPLYLKLLAKFDRVIAISAASARELRGYWDWLGINAPDPAAITLGADAQERARGAYDPLRSRRRSVVMTGILEPRKNQAAVLEAAAALWDDGLDFSLTLVGRVNPHFGKPIAARVRELARSGRPVRHVPDMDDHAVNALLADARFAVLPSIAEGCGLPALESLWAGVPVLTSDVAAIVESSGGGGNVVVPAGDTATLTTAMDEMIADDALIDRLTAEACSRPLPTWANTAEMLLAALR
jgi:glycosyltransferase involved in cell wall biosynthesis